MDGEDFKITIEGVEYRNINDIPEKYREIARRQLETARSAAETAAAGAVASGQGSHVSVKKHFEIKLNIKHQAGAPGGSAGSSAAPIKPSGISARARTILIALLILAALFWELFRLHVQR